MELDPQTEAAEDRPQWLGSLARQQQSTEGWTPTPIEETPTPEPATEGWVGSTVRKSLFEAPDDTAPEPIRDAKPIASRPQSDSIHVLPGAGRIVMGELGMTLRAA